jgi:hypothetical protein
VMCMDEGLVLWAGNLNAEGPLRGLLECGIKTGAVMGI